MVDYLFEVNLNQALDQTQTKNSIHVLLADSHQIVRDGLRQEIEKHEDIEVVGNTGNGHKVVQLTEQLCPDVIVLDVNLSYLSGIQVAKELQARRQQETAACQPDVLVFSNYDDKQYIWSMLATGVKGYLLKSDPPDVVVGGIRAVSSGQTILNQRVQNILLRFIPELYQDLSQSEITVLQLLAQGLSNDEIAHNLKISEGTVKSHLYNTYRKIPWVRTRAEAVAWAWINRIVAH